MKLNGAFPRNILCLGAHCDDIEIGCGGTILKYVLERKDIRVKWVVFSSDGRREEEAIRSANAFLKGVKDKAVSILRFRNSFFPHCWKDIKEYFEGMKNGFIPDVVFTHCREDLHQDHRVINELTWNTFRNHFILEYEIVKYDADLGSPNVFVCLNEKICKRKVDIILRSFTSQAEKNWFTEDVFMSIMRIRGVESGSNKKYAEAFYGRKVLL